MARIILLLFLGLVAFGCSDDPTGPPDVVFPDVGPVEDMSDMGEPDAAGDSGEDMPDSEPDADTDMPDPDMDSDMDPDMDPPDPCDACTQDQVCIEGECLSRDSCEIAVDLGMLVPGTPVTQTGSFVTEGVDTTASECGGEMSGRERVFRFELSERSLVSYDASWSGQFDGVLDFRRTCEDAGTTERCTDIEFGEAFLEAGEHFLVLEVKFGNPGQFELSLEVEAASCTPGEETCMGDDLAICDPSGQPEIAECGASCTAGACDGNVCAAPIVVTGNGGTFAGSGRAYDSNFNFSTNDSCGNTNQPGYDVVFSLPGLQAGAIVTIDTETGDANANGIFIMEGCSATPTCLQHFTGIEDVDWVAPAAGDYFIVVDKVINSSTPFNYSIVIN